MNFKMKGIKGFLFLPVFLLIFTFLLHPSATAHADDLESSSLKVDVTTDKQQYKVDDEVKYTITVTNAAKSDVKNVVVTSVLPKDFDVKDTKAKKDDNKLIWNVDQLAAGDKVTFSFVAKLNTNTPPPIDTTTSQGTTTAPQTGDNTNIAFYIVLSIISITILILATWLFLRKNGKKKLTTLLILLLIFPTANFVKAADETKDTVKNTTKVTIGEKVYEVTTTVEAVVEPPVETGPLSIDITSPKDDTYNADSDTITLEGISKGKKTSPIKYSVFMDDSLEPSLSGDVEGGTSWKISNLKLKQGTNHVVVAALDQDGNVVKDEIYIDYKNDEDNDGLSYSLEKSLGTDPLNPDTDGDKLLDGIEYSVTMTNPLLKDTNDDGILDSAEDPDSDGLTNLQELGSKTNPMSADTDSDGLKDGEEISTYKTSPTVSDTDGDTLSDGDEIQMGLDPLKKDTDGDGVLDSDEILTQKMTDDILKDVNTKDNTTQFNLTMTGKGNFNNAVTVLKTEEPVVKSIPGVVGTPVDLQSVLPFDKAKISFTLDDSLLKSKPLEDYQIIWFDDKENMVKPLDTVYDKDTNTLSADTTHFSKYMVIDTDAYYRGTDGGNTSDRIEKGKADVSFVLDSTGSMGGTINNVKTNIIDFVNRLSTKKVDVRLGLVDYKDINYDGLDSTRNHGWFDSPDQFKNELNGIYADGGGDDPESAVDALEEARTMGFAPNKAKFIVLLTDVNYHENTRFEGLNSMAEEISRLKKDNIVASAIIPTYYDYAYHDLYTETGGITANIFGNFSTELDKLIDNISEETNDKVTIRLSDGSLARLDKYPDKSDTTTDTDGDGVPDSEELIAKTTCYGGYDKMVECWTFKSRPDEVNSDNDVYSDKEYLEPTVTYAPSIVFVHGWTADNNNTFNVKTYLDGQNNSTDATSADQVEKFSNIENQAVTGFTSGLYKAVRDKVGGYSNLFTFTYPNLAHPAESAAILNKYLDNLVAAGKLKAPVAMSKPKVVFVVHSMGGLVSRYYTEKISDKSVDVDGVMTIATPHWGANFLSHACINDPLLLICKVKTFKQLTSPAAHDLDPTPVKVGWDWFWGPTYKRVESFTEGLNSGFSKGGTQYFAISGVFTVASKPVQLRYLEMNTNPADGDFIALARKRVKDALATGTTEPRTYDDLVVDLNSGFGSSHSLGESGFHEANKVLNFDHRYAIIGSYSDAFHTNLPNNPYTEETINYWIVKDIFSKYQNGDLVSVTEPNETN